MKSYHQTLSTASLNRKFQKLQISRKFKNDSWNHFNHLSMTLVCWIKKHFASSSHEKLLQETNEREKCPPMIKLLETTKQNRKNNWMGFKTFIKKAGPTLVKHFNGFLCATKHRVIHETIRVWRTDPKRRRGLSLSNNVALQEEGVILRSFRFK